MPPPRPTNGRRYRWPQLISDRCCNAGAAAGSRATKSETKVHAFTHAGAIEGRLQLHADAVSFVAYRIEDLLREEPTVLTIAADELRGVRVVGRGAGADGRPTRASAARSLFPRLVLDTDHGSRLFEVQFARRTARRIADELGAEVRP
jgi:hypothetical protein